jgi:hypothetical protein
MNSYIDAQIIHMKAMIKTFEQSCEMAARKSDGFIDKQEEKALKQIKAATNQFCKKLDKIKR